MPDDRFIHRRAGHSQKVNSLTDLEHRVWIQYLLSADDFGVMRGTHHPLQNDNDHLANRPAKAIQRCLAALVTSGLIQRFEHQGKPYVYQHDWQTWQKVSYPRTTTQPCPPLEALSDCDAATQELFRLHPGGAGKRRTERPVNTYGPFQEHSENVPEIVPEDSPLTRASAPAKRLTANGTRLTANGSEGGPGETVLPLDVAFQQFVAAYPGQGRCASHLAMTAFVDVLHGGAILDPQREFTALLERLEGHKRSHQWRVKEMIPRLDRYLREGLHLQELPEHPVASLVSEKTARTLTSGAQFVRGVE